MHADIAIPLEVQSASVLRFGNIGRTFKTWRGIYREARLRRKTEKLLSALDRSILEDLGIPHNNVSPTAGSLDRYPHVITIKPRKI
jgi:hypothetical protein